MTRRALFRWFVLKSTCDDYEDIVQITNYMEDVGPKCGLIVTRAEIIEELRALVELGFVKAYDLGKPQPNREPPKEVLGMPAIEGITPLGPYFLFNNAGGLERPMRLSANWMIDTNEHLHEIWGELAASLKPEELFRLFVRESVRDRYMTIGHIAKVAHRCGIAISKDEIIQALREMVELGHAKAFELDSRVWPAPEYDGMPPLVDIRPRGAYFLVTDEGLKFHDARDSWWPFEKYDEGELKLRVDWAPPDA